MFPFGDIVSEDCWSTIVFEDPVTSIEPLCCYYLFLSSELCYLSDDSYIVSFGLAMVIVMFFLLQGKKLVIVQVVRLFILLY